MNYYYFKNFLDFFFGRVILTHGRRLTDPIKGVHTGEILEVREQIETIIDGIEKLLA